jgi:phosphoribosylaminoimidazolecarboxamide formyltransferase / IMP cyclohydrolase
MYGGDKVVNRALISVYNKDGILEFAKFLEDRDVEIISTGGTYKYLRENGINVVEVCQITGFGEILDGRVKTLHPSIHGGILAVRDNEEHMASIKKRDIKPIDMVVVNLYPFFENVNKEISFEDKVEFIDIGGPTMIRAAGKNFKDVVVVTDVNDYKKVMGQFEESGDIEYNFRKHLAGKVFNLMSTYDAAICKFLLEDNEFPEYFTVPYKKEMNLRYGENPHQTAAFYVTASGSGAMKDFEQLGGKELSYNNIKDMDIAWKVVCEFEETVCCAVKHNTPCGVAFGENTFEAYSKTYECDPVSIFGGIVAFNKKIDEKTALELSKTFLEIVAAPEYDDEALDILKNKKNLRIIICKQKPQDSLEMSSVDAGMLVQSVNKKLLEEVKVVTEKEPSKEELADMIFGMKVAKYVKSNAIVVVKNGQAKGIAGGQVNRISATSQALDRANDGVVLASDAFFPFGDVVDEAHKYNIKAIIQPGGSLKDQESIDACNRYGIAMVFTGIRHFKH